MVDGSKCVKSCAVDYGTGVQAPAQVVVLSRLPLFFCFSFCWHVNHAVQCVLMLYVCCAITINITKRLRLVKVCAVLCSFDDALLPYTLLRIYAVALQYIMYIRCYTVFVIGLCTLWQCCVSAGPYSFPTAAFS